MRGWISSAVLLLVVGLSILKWRRAVPIAALFMAVVAGALHGCASGTVTIQPVAITDFRMVAGRWAGPLTAEGRPRQDDDWVDLTIAGDGAYAFAVDRKVGPFVGKGQFVLKDGKLMMDGERGRAAFTLIQADGGRRLRGDAVQAAGAPMWVDLLPSD